MKNIILIAPPAAGKGTISSELVRKYNYNHLSTGDLLRKVAKENNEVKEMLEEGKFIPDSIILPLFKEEFKNNTKPFILDGIPRTLEQAVWLKEVFQELNVNNYVVINMEISKDILEKRVTGRRICENCKSIYNIYFEDFKPLNESLCDKCSGKLITRTDDSLDTFNLRYETFLKETKPILNFYEQENVLKNVDATLKTEEILKEVENIIEV